VQQICSREAVVRTGTYVKNKRDLYMKCLYDEHDVYLYDLGSVQCPVAYRWLDSTGFFITCSVEYYDSQWKDSSSERTI